MEISPKIFMTYSRNLPPQKLNTSHCLRAAQSPILNRVSSFIISEGDCLFPSSQRSPAASLLGSTTWHLQPRRLPRKEPSTSVGSKLKKTTDFTTLKLTLRAVAFTISEFFALEHQKSNLKQNKTKLHLTAICSFLIPSL